MKTKERPGFLAKETGSGSKPKINTNSRQMQYNPKIVNHKIYDALITFLQYPRVVTPSGAVIAEPLHSTTKNGLRRLGWTESEITDEENSLFLAAEFMPGYQVLRDVPTSLYGEYEPEWFFENRVVSVPNFILNACVCEALQRRFSRRELLACPGFVEVCATDERGVIYRSIRLDTDERHARRGFIVPAIENGLIAFLKIYRYPKDGRPFALRSRKFNQGVTP